MVKKDKSKDFEFWYIIIWKFLFNFLKSFFFVFPKGLSKNQIIIFIKRKMKIGWNIFKLFASKIGKIL